VSERHLVLLISAVMFVDTTFYSVIAPLLPALVHQLHLSKLSAGIMAASYPVGTLAGSVPGGVLVARAGPKAAVMTGLALLAGSTVAFALLHNVVGLDAARFVEGVGGACSWSGGLAWLVTETSSGRRGALIGRALGAAIGGALFGPVIGALATVIGRVPAFSVVAVAALALLAETARLPARRAVSDQGASDLIAALRTRSIAVGVWLVALPAVVSGALTVLAPLRLHGLGGGAAAIGATFLVAAAVGSVVSPATGKLSDRRGRRFPLRLGLIATAALLVCFEVPDTVIGLAVLVVAIEAALGLFWAPAMAMLSEAADVHQLNQGYAAALMNLAWASGQVIGAAAGGGIAKATGDLVPMVIVAAMCVGTLTAVSRRSVRVSMIEARPPGP
jgi:MFS family permease